VLLLQFWYPKYGISLLVKLCDAVIINFNIQSDLYMSFPFGHVVSPFACVFTCKLAANCKVPASPGECTISTVISLVYVV
jgi:hypothetical protein